MDKKCTVVVVDCAMDSANSPLLLQQPNNKHADGAHHLAAFPSKLALAKFAGAIAVRRLLESARKSDEIGIVTFGARDEEAVGGEHESEFEDVAILAKIQTANPGMLLTLEAADEAVPDDSHDIAHAVMTATRLIKERTKTNKYIRTIVLITDGASANNLSTLRRAVDEAERGDVTVQVMGIDFGNPARSNPKQIAGESIVKKALGLPENYGGPEANQDDSDDDDASSSDSEEEDDREGANHHHHHSRHSLLSLAYDVTPLLKPNIPTVRQTVKFKGLLEIGGKAVDGVEMHVQLFSRIMPRKFPSLKKRIKRALQDSSSSTSSTRSRDKPTPGFFASEAGDVKMDRRYLSQTDLSRNVQDEDRSLGFFFGRTIVPLVGNDREALKLPSEPPGVKFLGVIPAGQLKREYLMGATDCLVADPGAINSQRGFSALVRALRDLERVGCARYVRKEGASPKFVALIPGVLPESAGPASGGDCLWMIRLPTDEDLRRYTFESLSAGKYLPSEAESAVFDRFVDAFTLRQEDAPSTKGFAPEFVPNPALCRYFDLLYARCLNIEAAVPPAASDPRALHPDVVTMKRAREVVDDVKRAFPLKRTAVKASVGGRGRGLTGIFLGGEGGISGTTTATRMEVESDGGVRLNALMMSADGQAGGGGTGSFSSSSEDAWFSRAGDDVDEVGQVTPVQDFFAMLNAKEDAVEKSRRAVVGMIAVIRQFVFTGGAPYFTKAAECVAALRKGCGQIGAESDFDDFARELKAACASREHEDVGPTFWRDHLVKGGFKLFSPRDAKEESEFLSEELNPGANEGGSGAREADDATLFGGAKGDGEEDLFDEME